MHGFMDSAMSNRICNILKSSAKSLQGRLIRGNPYGNQMPLVCEYSSHGSCPESFQTEQTMFGIIVALKFQKWREYNIHTMRIDQDGGGRKEAQIRERGIRAEGATGQESRDAGPVRECREGAGV